MPPISPFITTPCAPPCWQNITPGVTSIEEAKDIVFDELELQDQCTNTTEEDFIDCNNFAVLSNNVDRLVEYLVLHPIETITLEQIIGQFGEPERIYVGWDGSPEDPSEVRIAMPYFDDTVWFYFKLPWDAYLIKPDLALQLMKYYAPIYTDRISLGFNGIREMEWNGYGDYNPYD